MSLEFDIERGMPEDPYHFSLNLFVEKHRFSSEIEQKHNSSKLMLSATDFPGYFEKMKEELGEEERGSFEERTRLEDDGSIVKHYIFPETSSTEPCFFHAIVIQAFSDGTIIIGGDPMGSGTILKRDEWVINRDIQREAMDKALRNPVHNAEELT